MNVASTSSLMRDAMPNIGAPDQSAPRVAKERNESATDRSPFAARLAAMQSKEAQTNPAREAANKLIASAFIIPTLQSLRENSLAPEEGPFSPNIAQKRFGPILDQHIADNVVTGSNFKLVDTIVDQFSRSSGGMNKQVNDVLSPSPDEHAPRLNVKG